MYFPLVFKVSSRACFLFNTFRTLYCIFYAVIGQFLVLLLSAVSCISLTLAVLLHSLTSILFLTQVEEFVQKHELESGESLTVKGNLRQNLAFWRSIGAPNFILTINGKGCKLPFASIPLAVRLKNNNSVRILADFVDQAVLELINSGRVCKVFKQPFIVNPLSVSIQPSGKKRLILDLRHVNRSLIKQSQIRRLAYWLISPRIRTCFLLIWKVDIIMSKFRRITKRFWAFAGVLQIQITKYFTFSPFFPLACPQLPIYSKTS